MDARRRRRIRPRDGAGWAGRGWTSPARALMFSLVLRPEPAGGSRRAALAARRRPRWREACDELAGRRAACKWPNDLLVGGRKAGGILAESRLDGDRFEHVVARRRRRTSGRRRPSVPEAGAVEAEDVELLAAFLRSVRAPLRARAARRSPARVDRRLPGALRDARRPRPGHDGEPGRWSRARPSTWTSGRARGRATDGGAASRPVRRGRAPGVSCAHGVPAQASDRG